MKKSKLLDVVAIKGEWKKVVSKWVLNDSK